MGRNFWESAKNSGKTLNRRSDCAVFDFRPALHDFNSIKAGPSDLHESVWWLSAASSRLAFAECRFRFPPESGLSRFSALPCWTAWWWWVSSITCARKEKRFGCRQRRRETRLRPVWWRLWWQVSALSRWRLRRARARKCSDRWQLSSSAVWLPQLVDAADLTDALCLVWKGGRRIYGGELKNEIDCSRRPLVVDRLIVALEDIENFPGFDDCWFRRFRTKVENQRRCALNPFKPNKFRIEIAASMKWLSKSSRQSMNRRTTGKKATG